MKILTNYKFWFVILIIFVAAFIYMLDTFFSYGVEGESQDYSTLMNVVIKEFTIQQDRTNVPETSSAISDESSSTSTQENPPQESTITNNVAEVDLSKENQEVTTTTSKPNNPPQETTTTKSTEKNKVPDKLTFEMKSTIPLPSYLSDKKNKAKNSLQQKKEAMQQNNLKQTEHQTTPSVPPKNNATSAIPQATTSVKHKTSPRFVPPKVSPFTFVPPHFGWQNDDDESGGPKIKEPMEPKAEQQDSTSSANK